MKALIVSLGFLAVILFIIYSVIRFLRSFEINFNDANEDDFEEYDTTLYDEPDERL